MDHCTIQDHCTIRDLNLDLALNGARRREFYLSDFKKLQLGYLNENKVPSRIWRLQHAVTNGAVKKRGGGGYLKEIKMTTE